MRKTKILTLAFVLVLLISTTIAFAGVTPDYVEVLLNPDESYEVEKTVTNPEIPAKMDFLLLEDESGSFADDITLMKGTYANHTNGLAAAIWDGLDAEGIEFRGGVAGFVDFAQSYWGGSGPYGNDWVYRLYQDMTTNKTLWLSGIGLLKTNNGADGPEAQLAALMSAANGAAWDSNGDGDYIDAEDTPAGQDPSWDNGSTKIVILVTDAPYHVNGDSGGWPGPRYNDTVAALNAEGIHVVILSTYTGWYTNLANDTGGAVNQISSNSADIVDALMAALEEVKTDVWYNISSPDELTIDITPAMYSDVSGGSELKFNETITVAGDAAPGVYIATVTFYANTWPHEGSVIGTETINVTVNGKPNCGGAYADNAILWPPNHKMVPIQILNVTDPDGDDVNITITGIGQDEPTEGLGDGDMAPDAVNYGSYAEVRAERSGLGDGRVYRIYFTADDGKGGVCRGYVTVGVPHDKKDTPVDSRPPWYPSE